MIRYKGIEIDRDRGIIRHRGRERKFHCYKKNGRDGESIQFKTMVYMILGGGVSIQQMFWHVWADDPEGGPLEGPHVFNVYFAQWRQRGVFWKLDLDLRTTKISGVTFYHVEPTYQLGMQHAAE